MENNSSSMLASMAHIVEFVELLKENVVVLDRANIVLLCSHIQYCLSDILELTSNLLSDDNSNIK